MSPRHSATQSTLGRTEVLPNNRAIHQRPSENAMFVPNTVPSKRSEKSMDDNRFLDAKLSRIALRVVFSTSAGFGKPLEAEATA